MPFRYVGLDCLCGSGPIVANPDRLDLAFASQLAQVASGEAEPFGSLGQGDEPLLGQADRLPPVHAAYEYSWPTRLGSDSMRDRCIPELRA